MKPLFESAIRVLRLFVLASALLLLAFVPAPESLADPAAIAACKGIHPKKVEVVLSRFQKQMKSHPSSQTEAIYLRHRPVLARLAPCTPSLPLLITLADMQVIAKQAVSAARTIHARLEKQSALDPREAYGAAKRLLQVQADLSLISPEIPLDLLRVGRKLERLEQSGLSFGLTPFQRNSPSPGGLADLILKIRNYFKAGKTVDELAETGELNTKEFIDRTTSLVPDAASPMLGGPVGEVLKDQLKWNSDLWDAATEGLDLVGDAIENGELDQDRVRRNRERIEELAEQGPVTEETVERMAESWVESIPGVGRVVKFLKWIFD